MRKKYKGQLVRGYIQEGKPIISGELVFYLMDSIGLPLEEIMITLREYNVGFDIQEFAAAATRSNNFTAESIRNKLRRVLEEKGRDIPDWVLAGIMKL